MTGNYLVDMADAQEDRELRTKRRQEKEDHREEYEE